MIAPIVDELAVEFDGKLKAVRFGAIVGILNSIHPQGFGTL